MKNGENLFPGIYEYEALHKAYTEVKADGIYYESAQAFTANLDENLIVLQNELIYKTYALSRGDDGVNGWVPAFRDCIVRVALDNLISSTDEKINDPDVLWLVGRMACDTM
jgi:hypothetical protein